MDENVEMKLRRIAKVLTTFCVIGTIAVTICFGVTVGWTEFPTLFGPAVVFPLLLLGNLLLKAGLRTE